MQPPLKPDVALYLFERYRHHGLTRAGLASMWLAAWSWVEERVPAHLMNPASMPDTFEAVAILRVQFTCSSGDAHSRQALAFAAQELIAPYAG